MVPPPPVTSFRLPLVLVGRPASSRATSSGGGDDLCPFHLRSGNYSSADDEDAGNMERETEITN